MNLILALGREAPWEENIVGKKSKKESNSEYISSYQTTSV